MEALFEQAQAQGHATVPSATLSGDERRKLTLEAERRGWVAYKELDDVTHKPCLVITRSRNEACDPDKLTPPQLKVLGDLCNVPLSDSATVLQDLSLFGIQDGAQLVADAIDEIRRYGSAGLKRRDRILQEEMEHALRSQPEYKAFQEGAAPILAGAVDPSMTIMRVVYQVGGTCAKGESR
jgi:hypothetical protein